MILVLMILSVYALGWLKGYADTLQTDVQYTFQTWKRKWKLDRSGVVKKWTEKDPHWWYFHLYVTEDRCIEKFPFSSTILVWTTDPWHLVNFISHRIVDVWIIIAVTQLQNKPFACGLLITIPLLRFLGFETTFRKPV